MKKLVHPLLFLALFAMSCQTEDEPKPTGGQPLDINFYAAQNVPIEEDAIQLTLKNDEVQMTAFGVNTDGVQRMITKVYLSDVETQTEWMILVNESLQPEFVYAINSATHEKLPYLYGIEPMTGSRFMLRYYDYDWENRLGTLQYEAEIDGDDVNVIFDNQLSEGGRGGKTSQSHPAPVPGFEKRRKPSSLGRLSEEDETMDQQFDNQVSGLMKLLQETKTKLIQAPCTVSKILNKSDKNFVCKLADQLNKVTDEKIFGDIQQTTQEPQSGDNYEYDGNASSLNVKFFDVDDFVNNVRDHVNDVRNSLSDGFNLQEWLTEFHEFTETINEDLDDLTDASGVIQIGLSWNTTVDIDLHVVDPFGEEIYYNHPASSSGGYLDRDDVDGFGPENIYWTENIPDGTYKVYLVYYDPSTGPVTDFTVRVINGLGVSETFVGALGYFEGNKVHIVNFKKMGNTITF
jgi:hypothetical protein